MGEVKYGPYGYYYSYKNDKGQDRFQNIPKNDYEKYYTSGYLTNDMLEMIVEQSKEVKFKIPRKDGLGDKTVTAKLIPHISYSGKKCKKIDFQEEDVETSKDIKTIQDNLEKIATSYCQDGKNFDWHNPQKVLSDLGVDKKWRTYAETAVLAGKTYGRVNIYQAAYAKTDDTSFLVFCTVDHDRCIMIDKSVYDAAIAAEDEIREKAREKQRLNIAKADTIIDWLCSIDICESKAPKDIIAAFDPLVTDVECNKDMVAGYLQSSKVSLYPSHIIDDAKTDVKYHLYYKEVTDDVIKDFKNKILQKLKVMVEYYKLVGFRRNLYERYTKEGLASITEAISIDTALDLGYFNQVQKILVKYKSDTPRYIINNLYLDELDITVLENKLLNMLKVYYDFYDFPEKDRKAIAKFVAKNKLSDYYETISNFEDVIEVIIDNSRDPKLTKPILESIAGTSKADCLKDKTYYFEKRARLVNNVILNKPIELLDSLRECIKAFNVSSTVAILTNIELNADESFTFQFYTFANSDGDESGFDGRRMLNLTKIYNKLHPTQKIGFTFDN